MPAATAAAVYQTSMQTLGITPSAPVQSEMTVGVGEGQGESQGGNKGAGQGERVGKSEGGEGSEELSVQPSRSRVLPVGHTVLALPAYNPEDVNRWVGQGL
jgi:hypothetical protein